MNLKIARLFLAVTATLAVGACSGGGPKPEQDTEAAAAQSELQPSEPEPEPQPDQADLDAYFEAVASNDPQTLLDAVGLAAPGSNAHAYLIYLAGRFQADADTGLGGLSSTLTPTESGFEICMEGTDNPEPCTTFTEFEGEGGKIASFAVGGQSLTGRISLGSGEPQELGGVGEAELLATYESEGDWVVAVFEVGSTVPGLVVKATYVAPDGSDLGATYINGPSALREGTFANYAFMFQGAELGGTVTLQPSAPDYPEAPAVSFRTD